MTNYIFLFGLSYLPKEDESPSADRLVNVQAKSGLDPKVDDPRSWATLIQL